MHKLEARSFLLAFKPNPIDFNHIDVDWEEALATLWIFDKDKISEMINHLNDNNGFAPVEVWSNGVVRNGHHRIAAHVALQLPIEYVRCYDA